jgi:RimJ/RimL family protein N-acetyltransferase/acyl carrier protein
VSVTQLGVGESHSDTGCDFTAFCALLEVELGCSLAGHGPDAHLIDDLGWDSLALFEVLSVFERHGADVPDELIGALRTLDDLHHYFTLLTTRGPSDEPHALCPSLDVPTAGDTDYLLRLHTIGEHLVRYRLRGQTPSPESFHRLLWEGVVAQFILRSDSGAPVGLVSCFGADFRNRHAHIGVLGDPAWHGSGVLIAGAWRFVGYLFAEFDFRKLYAEVLEANFAAMRTGVGRLFEIEGRLTHHEYLGGGYQDVLVLALDRERWRAQHERLVAVRRDPSP